MTGAPVLSDDTITLRPHQLSDADEVVVQCTDPESIRWTTVPTPYSRADAESYVTTGVPQGWATRTDLGFAIEATHPDGERKFSGSVSLRPKGEGIAELAFGLHPAVRGAGVCSRAVKLILDWGFGQPDIEVVTWYAFVGNWGSWRVAWANGFTFHGSVRALLPHRGQRLDSWHGTLRAGDDRQPKHEWHVAPVLASARLRLRPHHPEDAPRYGELLTDERSRHFAGRTPLMLSRPTPEHVIHRALEFNARGERFDWTIADQDDVFIGQIQAFGLGGLDVTSAELGYSMHPDARGKGVMTEALGMVTEWAFRPRAQGGRGLRKLTLTTAGSNKASCHAAEKAGFARVATVPETFPTGEKGFEDEAVYQRINPSWTE